DPANGGSRGGREGCNVRLDFTSRTIAERESGPMTIKDLPAAMRPREKLLAHGPAALADAELVALLLRTGMKGKGVLALAEELLGGFRGVAGLLHSRAEDFKR